MTYYGYGFKKNIPYSIFIPSSELELDSRQVKVVLPRPLHELVRFLKSSTTTRGWGLGLCSGILSSAFDNLDKIDWLEIVSYIWVPSRSRQAN
jgi:hypothetical protein